MWPMIFPKIKFRHYLCKAAGIFVVCDGHTAFDSLRVVEKIFAVLLAVNGMPVKEIAALYNESPTTISYWTKKVVGQGVDSLKPDAIQAELHGLSRNS